MDIVQFVPHVQVAQMAGTYGFYGVISNFLKQLLNDDTRASERIREAQATARI